MSITAQAARAAAEQYREEGFAIVRQFVDGDALTQLRTETARMYDEGMTHPTTFRHGNLCFEILPERDFGRRYVIQAYWMSWISDYFERFRRSDDTFTLLEPFLGRDIKQIAQQIHWKPPGAGLTGYRWHQDLRFRPKREEFREIEASSVTIGLAVDPADGGDLSVLDPYIGGLSWSAGAVDDCVIERPAGRRVGEVYREAVGCRDVDRARVRVFQSALWMLRRRRRGARSHSLPSSTTTVESHMTCWAAPSRSTWPLPCSPITSASEA